ncbi:A/G-specific adenine glycosylase [Enterococcus asini]|uniref:A/G-specific adenine glycosylase n=1 Tax=Enterococcus asini TaxID=57732 RepID=UPI00288FE1A5|nr:A/G-specific adenine glycosylase [Enterococcus asini]MDT2756803.1 A/G-specific adenine glycosylase [Enterococcus asini]
MNNWERLSSKEIKNLQEDFLNWYDQNRRNLPWRENHDPYRIWISEIMLQQTRVVTVIDYFYRFMAAFPDIATLAVAPEEQLLKIWEGLGYYSRARNIQAAAKEMVEKFNGQMPRTLPEIASLKGIGPYTAGAIASIAFGLPEPAIDGNVMRVVSRLFEIDADIAKPASRKVFDQGMRQILPKTAPGDFNQAMMDLGSSICTPKSPNCAVCPLQNYCLAYQKGNQENYPVKTKKQPPKPMYYLAFAIENSEQEYGLIQRGEQGLLAKMWTFPLLEVTKEEYQRYQRSYNTGQLELERTADLDFVAEEALPELPNLAIDLGNVVWQTRHLGEISHIFSHLKWQVLLFYGRQIQENSPSDQVRWVSAHDFPNFVFPKPQQKLVALLQKNGAISKDF